MAALRFIPVALFLAVAGALLLFAAGPALAQDSGSGANSGADAAISDDGSQDTAPGPERIDRRLAVGGYRLFIEGEASNLSLGTALFSVAVLNDATGEPVSNARVVLRTQHEGNGPAGWATALSIPERPEIYRAKMKLDYPGLWLVSVDVAGPLGRVETEVGTVIIPEPRQYLSGTLVFAGTSVILLLGTAYVVWQIRRTQRRRDEVANANAG